MHPAAYYLTVFVILCFAHIPTAGSAWISFEYYTATISFGFGLALGFADFFAPLFLCERSRGLRAIGAFLVMMSLMAGVGANLGARSSDDAEANNAARRLAQIDTEIDALSEANDDDLRATLSSADAKVSAAESQTDAELKQLRSKRDDAVRLAKLETEGGEVNGVIYSACPVNPSSPEFEARCPNAHSATTRARTASADLGAAERLATAKLKDLREAAAQARHALDGGPKARKARKRELETERREIAPLAAGASNEVSDLAGVTGLRPETIRLAQAVLAGFAIVLLGIAGPVCAYARIGRLPPPKAKPQDRSASARRKRLVNTPKAAKKSTREASPIESEATTPSADVLPLHPRGMSPRELAEWRRHRIAFLDENEPDLKNHEIAARIGATPRTVQNLRKQVSERKQKGEQFRTTLHPQLHPEHAEASLDAPLGSSHVDTAKAAAL